MDGWRRRRKTPKIVQVRTCTQALLSTSHPVLVLVLRDYLPPQSLHFYLVQVPVILRLAF